MIKKTLGNKIECELDGRKIVLTRDLCNAGGKVGLHWIGEDFYVPDKDIPEDAVLIEEHNLPDRKLLYKPKKVDHSGDWKAFERNSEANMKQLREIDKQQKEKGDILYRYLSFPYADGFSLYQITGLNARTVNIKSVTGIGDDWQSLGEKATLDYANVMDNLNHRDHLDEIFKQRNS